MILSSDFSSCSYEMEELIRESWPLKCCFVVKEIMQTEIAYVQALADIIKVQDILNEYDSDEHISGPAPLLDVLVIR